MHYRNTVLPSPALPVNNESNMACADTILASRYACYVRSSHIDPRALGRNVRRLCKVRGITLDELAERAGISSVKMMMKRGSGRTENIAKVAAALGVTVDDLLAPQREVSSELQEFLDSPLGRDVNATEKDELRDLEVPGRKMTVESYYLALKMLRASEPA